MSKFVAPNLDQLIEEWNIDSAIDTTDAGGQMIKIPVIHSKYNKYLSLHKLSVVRKQQLLDKLMKTKWLWINGKLSKQELDELKLEPFLLTILKPDQQAWLDADKDIQESRMCFFLHVCHERIE
jgi:hypothetical protein